jgi:3-hydroxybutyryl-CoA dehydrogenase
VTLFVDAGHGGANARRAVLAVLGAGTMGRGIAEVALAAGYDTTLFDVSNAALESARAWIERHDSSLLGRLTTAGSVAAAVGDAAFVIEAVPEQMALKLATFAEVQAHAPADAVLATNTSALSITEMAAALDTPARLAGMHFFNPVHKMKLVEIIRAHDTSDETLAAVEDVARRMGKDTVIVRESPGFVTSRINAMIGNEAFYLLHDGVASARDIDKAMKLGLNHPMGPFELVDLVGLDTRLSILQHLHRTLGEKFRPCPLLEEYVRQGRLGKKVGRGVYEYGGP